MKKRIILILIVFFFTVSVLINKGDADNYNFDRKTAEIYLYFQSNFDKALNEFDHSEMNNKSLIIWMPYQVDLTLPGDMIDDQGHSIIQVYLSIDPNQHHKKIEHREKLLDSVILVQDQTLMYQQIKLTANKVIAVYQKFIEINVKNGLLIKPTDRLMNFYSIFKERLFEFLKGEFGYNEVLGWKFYFPKEKGNTVYIEFETIHYRKIKIFKTQLTENSQKQINLTYALVEKIINWLHITLRQGLNRGILKVGPGSTICFSEDNRCFGNKP